MTETVNEISYGSTWSSRAAWLIASSFAVFALSSPVAGSPDDADSPAPRLAPALSAFEEETAVERLDDNRWSAHVTDRWNIGETPNGGYLVAIAVRGVSGSFRNHRRPRRASPGARLAHLRRTGPS